jgi:Cys-tRNA(Pro)/Cys-tRNA(Cys) deacylase
MRNDMISNNVTRFLESKKVPFDVFELPIEKLGAEETAELLGASVSNVYKTIVVKREKIGKSILALTPGDKEVNLKLLASVIGEKKLILPTQDEAEKITGLLAGGISPLALLNRGFQIVIDSSAITLDQIYISGGQRGLNIRLAVVDLIDLTHARVKPITSSK